MKVFFTERNIVVVLFVMVLVTFSLAQNETKRMEQRYNGGRAAVKSLHGSRLDAKVNIKVLKNLSSLAE